MAQNTSQKNSPKFTHGEICFLEEIQNGRQGDDQ
jgi:hypothetical protein